MADADRGRKMADSCRREAIKREMKGLARKSLFLIIIKEKGVIESCRQLQTFQVYSNICSTVFIGRERRFG